MTLGMWGRCFLLLLSMFCLYSRPKLPPDPEGPGFAVVQLQSSADRRRTSDQWQCSGSESVIRTRMPGQLRCDITILLNCVVCRLEGGGAGWKRIRDPDWTWAVVGGRRAPEDEIVVLGLGSGGRKCCASSRRRDVEEGRTRTRAWVRDVDLRSAQFSSATAGTACTRSRRVTAGTGTDALRGVGQFATWAFEETRAAWGMLRISVAFHDELVRLEDETPSFCSFGCLWFCGRRHSRYGPRAPAVSAPSRAHTNTAGAAVRALLHAGETEIAPREHSSPLLRCRERKHMCERYFSRPAGRVVGKQRFNAEAPVGIYGGRPIYYGLRVLSLSFTRIPDSRFISHSTSR
ncbi:hypothetical protein B0H13DRAFT_1866482 [Mycena leptocephala]|nr:hypothetical protein B0H13DRAFT_1866482 [Mycena leptocephala]